jgi:NAD(P)-dependent dehydrogenase (short-subunit alcohol dehydrogenase family)
MKRLEGQRIIVARGSRGIGKAIVLGLMHEETYNCSKIF